MLHLNTYVIGLWPLYIINSFNAGINFRPQILMSKVRSPALKGLKQDEDDSLSLHCALDVVDKLAFTAEVILLAPDLGLLTRPPRLAGGGETLSSMSYRLTASVVKSGNSVFFSISFCSSWSFVRSVKSRADPYVLNKVLKKIKTSKFLFIFKELNT